MARYQKRNNPTQTERDNRSQDNELVILRAEVKRLNWELDRANYRLRRVREFMDAQHQQKAGVA